VAEQAEGADIIQIAFSSALCHRDDMIGVPQCSSTDPLQTPAREQLLPVDPARPLQVMISRPAIDPANGTDSVVAGQHLLTQVARVGSQTPLVDAPFRAERESSGGNLQTAPATQRAAVTALLQSRSIGKPAGHGARSAHKTFLPQIVAWPCDKRKGHATQSQHWSNVGRRLVGARHRIVLARAQSHGASRRRAGAPV